MDDAVERTKGVQCKVDNFNNCTYVLLRKGENITSKIFLLHFHTPETVTIVYIVVYILHLSPFGNEN